MTTKAEPESEAMLRYLIRINDDQIAALSRMLRCELCMECRWTSCQLAGALRIRESLLRDHAQQVFARMERLTSSTPKHS